MTTVKIYHYPHWGSSKNALAVAEELGVEAEIIEYIKTPPTKEDLEELVKILKDPVEDLVRKDSKFKKLEIKAEDFEGNPDAVVEILVKHKQLLQRPIIVKGKKGIIGRPKSKIAEFLKAWHLDIFFQ